MSAPFYEVGLYACKITDQALGAAGTGTPQITVQFKVQGKVDPDDSSRFIPAPAQYTRTYYRAITEKTIEYVIEDLKALRFTGESFRDLNSDSPNFCDLRGNDVDMWCAHEDDQQGNKREKWSVARGIAAKPLEVKPLDSKKLRELDNLYGKSLKALKSKPAEPKAKPASASQPASGGTGLAQGAPSMREDGPPPYVGADEDVPF